MLCLPQLDGQIVLGRLLDRDAGVFEFRPAGDATAEVRYARDTNVLANAMACGRAVRRWSATPCSAVPGVRPRAPRSCAALTASVAAIRMRYRLLPRFGEGLTPPEAVSEVEHGFRIDGPGLTLLFGAAEARWEDGELSGELELGAGERATITFSVGDQPLDPDTVCDYMDATIRAWRAWASGLHCEGRWAAAIRRSALALRMLVRDTTGSIAAAGSLGLPEQPGGERNYDYRYCWLRDASFVVDAFCSVGARESARRYLEWLGRALDSTAPTVQPFYCLDGGTEAEESRSALLGYRGASPVRIGNRAYQQLQICSYGDLLQSCALMRSHRVELPLGAAPQLWPRCRPPDDDLARARQRHLGD